LRAPEPSASQPIGTELIEHTCTDTGREPQSKGDRTYDKVNEVPEQFRNRILAVRSFDAKAMMVANQLVDGNEIEPVLEKMLAPLNVDYLHVHFAPLAVMPQRCKEPS
jgi:Protein of unknown function (DUF1203)